MALAVLARKNAKPNNAPQIVITPLTLHWSDNHPQTTPSVNVMARSVAAAPETAVLDQPMSSVSGFTNTPNEPVEPHVKAIVRANTATITQ